MRRHIKFPRPAGNSIKYGSVAQLGERVKLKAGPFSQKPHSDFSRFIHGLLAQLGERLVRNQEVEGSS